MNKQFLVACAILASACASVPPTPPADPHTYHATSAKSDVDPAATLRPDAFDAAVPISVAEATPDPPAPHGQPATDDRQPLYVCPMHPDVTSASPGKCPKCGMSLVIRKAHP